MNVLMFNYEYPPIGGGAANATEHLLEEMAMSDTLNVDLVTSSPGTYIEEELSSNITIYKQNVNKDEIHHWKQTEILRYMWRGLTKGKELDKKNDYDLIHAWFGFPCGLMARTFDIPYIVALRGSDVPGYNDRFSKQYVLLRPVLKNVWKNAKKVIPNSKGLKNLAQETMPIEMEVIPNGINTQDFTMEYNYDREKLQVLCVSRLVSRKRISDVIRAIKDTDSVELTVIGEGQQKEKLEELSRNLNLESRVKFLGYVPHERISHNYRKSDIFVLASLNEGMSNTILEAMASGLPIITTQTGGTDELIGENGEIVQKRKPSAIREKILEYKNNPGKLKEESRISRKRAEEMSWKSIAKQYINIYETVV